MMWRHIALMVCLAAGALFAGVAMVPGEREQWTMLVRDGHNEEALKIVRAHYESGRRDVDAVMHLYKLHMAFAEIEPATRVLEDFAADHPRNADALTMLAKHYRDIQDTGAEIATLERLFELSPTAQTARDLLGQYRLAGAFGREEKLLRSLLAKEMISANDAERLGLMLAARGDLYGAREALLRFDEIANPERSLGRFVLFDVMVATGDKSAALEKAVSWIGHFRKASVHHAPEGDTSAARLVRMMMAVDEAAARTLICQAQREDMPTQGSGAPKELMGCDGSRAGIHNEAGALTGTASIEPRERGVRRRPQ
jgi:tetratricopeptide (TPR) repeat protein